MNNKTVFSFVFFFVCVFASAQKSKVQATWRALSDYEETLKEGKPNISYLNKAKESVDLALAHADTKDQPKVHAYKLRISYAQFQYDLTEEIKKLESTITDKNERMLVAYGNTSLTDFENAAEELNKIKDLDPKYLDDIQEAINHGSANLDEDELRLAMATKQMKIEAANIASGKYKAQKYEEAADYFYKTAIMNSILQKSVDTLNFNNACIAAAKSKNSDKIMFYNKKMIDAKISAPFNYETLYSAQLEKSDSTGAMETLRKGRVLFPNDVGLLTQETNLFLAKGKQQEALNNLQISTEKDPTNALYYFIIGNIYDNLANPKDPITKKELPKPSNFTELFAKAEKNYLKAIELKPAKQEYLYNSLYNLGAMYNNYGGNIANSQGAKISQANSQKNDELKAQEYYKKAIPYLEQALAIRSDDRPTMSALRKLYLLTGNEVKAKQLNERLKASE